MPRPRGRLISEAGWDFIAGVTYIIVTVAIVGAVIWVTAHYSHV